MPCGRAFSRRELEGRKILSVHGLEVGAECDCVRLMVEIRMFC